jgi:hypothetical protein
LKRLVFGNKSIEKNIFDFINVLKLKSKTMAAANASVIAALRQTSQNLKNNEAYQWGHMGACNCGHLARVVTPFTKAEIHQYAVATREGDWSEMVAEYCSVSNAPIDMVIAEMLNSGFSISDLQNLEYLSDPQILKKIGKLTLNRNSRADLIEYLDVWVAILEEKFIENVSIQFDFSPSKMVIMQ